MEFFKLFSPYIIVCMAAIIAMYRYQIIKRKDHTTEMLVEAYLALEQAFTRNYDTNSFYKQKENEYCEAYENAIAKMQLLGNSTIAELAYKITEEPDDEEIRVELLSALRDCLREELGLLKIKKPPRSLRFKINHKNM